MVMVPNFSSSNIRRLSHSMARPGGIGPLSGYSAAPHPGTVNLIHRRKPVLRTLAILMRGNRTDWLPEGKIAGICFSIDDVHPATANDPYEAGGDLRSGALGRFERLLDRHPHLRATLFVTPDWRPIQLVKHRPIASLPLLGEHVYHVDLHPKGRFRLDRHPDFVRYLNDLPRTEVAPHGLHHVHRGSRLATEFQGQSHRHCMRILRRSMQIFESAGLRIARGFAPPGWNLPEALSKALSDLQFEFVSSARDIRAPVSHRAVCRMSGIQNVSLIRPQRIAGALVHVPVNFQATSDIERAEQIIAGGGVLSIKAHVFKTGGGFTLLDGLDDSYCDYLDWIFTKLEGWYGDSLWWAAMSQVAEQWRSYDETADSRLTA